MKKSPETRAQKLATALNTVMEYRTPEQHKIIQNAAQDYLQLSNLLHKVLKEAQ